MERYHRLEDIFGDINIKWRSNMAKEVSKMVLDDEEIMKETPVIPDVDNLFEEPKTSKQRNKQ